ncbi:hypothetical protein [Paractinoplanes globisporus]|uniref:Uncharacterized protein n=1 Tax=Paractinoplanes globisporus TaxID=113565 RepID=A0ABW6W457_9ACTN|nr:hypothetical protein [Actinoplanes globisporus]
MPLTTTPHTRMEEQHQRLDKSLIAVDEALTAGEPGAAAEEEAQVLWRLAGRRQDRRHVTELRGA